jgi:hypothetical protein
MKKPSWGNMEGWQWNLGVLIDEMVDLRAAELERQEVHTKETDELGEAIQGLLYCKAHLRAAVE